MTTINAITAFNQLTPKEVTTQKIQSAPKIKIDEKKPIKKNFEQQIFN
jgi:hypothetical protein